MYIVRIMAHPRTQALLNQIESYLKVRSLGPHRFGILAAKDGRLVERLKAGGRLKSARAMLSGLPKKSAR